MLFIFISVFLMMYNPEYAEVVDDKDKIINIDYSSMMGYIVTCEGVTNMSYMFSRVELYGLDLSNFDTGKVTNMSGILILLM